MALAWWIGESKRRRPIKAPSERASNCCSALAPSSILSPDITVSSYDSQLSIAVTLGAMGRSRYGLILENEIRRQLLDDEQTPVDAIDARRWTGRHERRHIGSLRRTTANWRLGFDDDAVAIAGVRHEAANELESGPFDRLLRGQRVHAANVRDRHHGDGRLHRDQQGR